LSVIGRELTFTLIFFSCVFEDTKRPTIDIGNHWYHVVCHRVPIPHDSWGDRTAIDARQAGTMFNRQEKTIWIAS
jgi:hypothetical protein